MMPVLKGSRLMKFLVPTAVLILILCIAAGTGCGGGGGGTTGNETTTTGGPPRAEAALAADPNHQIDARNIQAGQSVQFEIVNYDSNNVRHILSSSNWTTTDNGNSAGTLQSNGLFTATASSNGTVFTATGTNAGVQYNLPYQVTPVQAIATASVIDDNGAPAAGVTVLFYNSAGVVVGRSTTSVDGSLEASLPTTAVSLNIDPTTLPTSLYFKSFVL